MENVSYKLKLLSIYVITLIIISVLLYNLFSTIGTTNVGTISKENFKSKSLEREAYLHDFFYPYFTSIKAVQKSKIMEQYLLDELSQETMENYFLDIKKSLPCLTQVRFLDTEGIERVRVEGTPIGLYKERAISQITPQDKLQNKIDEEYVQKFLQLKHNNIGLSKINLNKENGKISLPKQPTLRIGISVYDNFGDKKGILVFNLCLRTFFQLINKTTLYHVHLIDDKGHYLNHSEPEYGLLGNNANHTVFHELPDDAKDILIKDHHFGDNIYSLKVGNFENGQNIKILLELKYDDALKEATNTTKNFLIFAFILAIAFLLIAIYFAKLPDILKRNAEKEKLTSKLANLPNRLSLMKDLSSNKFENSIVILISLRNIFKIRNTYGHEIANELVIQLSKYLTQYNPNIEKIYVNSYNIFALKYLYESDKELDRFLKELIIDIENHPFAIYIDANEVEFSIEVSLGVSNPDLIHNSIEELNEAENALEYALEKKTHLEIFSHSFHENIKENKENLLLAKKIKKAIDNDGIFLHFQPIYNNFTEKIEKYESLIRMECGGVLFYPDKFLPIAKQINKYNTLSYIVIDKAFAYFKDKEYNFSINLSILDIENPEFRKYFFERLDYYNISDQVVLEIVEQEGVENYDEFFEFIKKIKEHGCKIAIDDFGSGYSNYEHIIKASEYIDYLKIDGSLIKNLPKDPKIQILVGSLKFLCDNLNIQTIAEYVEDEEVLKYVQSIGIDYSQGYHIGKPKDKLLSEE